VTKGKFLATFGFGWLRDLPDREAIEDAGLLRRETAPDAEDPLDALIGLGADADRFADDSEDVEVDATLVED
jgi:hypothetical protein